MVYMLMMKRNNDVLCSLIFEECSKDSLADFLKSERMRSTEKIPNPFDGMTLNHVLYYLAHSKIVSEEYRDVLREMSEVASKKRVALRRSLIIELRMASITT